MLAVNDCRLDAYNERYRAYAAKSMLILHRFSLDHPAVEKEHRIGDDWLGGSIMLGRYPATGAGCTTKSTHRCPYHLLIRTDGVIDHLLPVFLVAHHARKWNRASIGVAVVGDFRSDAPTTQQWHTVTQLAAVFHAIGFDVWGHTELREASHDPAKVCPGPLMPMQRLRSEAGKIARSLDYHDASSVLLDTGLYTIATSQQR